jgi:hypothetical protein
MYLRGIDPARVLTGSVGADDAAKGPKECATDKRVQVQLAPLERPAIMIRRLSLCFVAPLALVFACKGEHGSTDVPGTTPPPSMSASASEAQDVGAPITDARLATAIIDAMALDPVLRSQSVHPSVADGAVTLTGTVRTLAAKRRATRLVADFKGVAGQRRDPREGLRPDRRGDHEGRA